MILYVDETENDEYFIVTGLLVNSEKDINDVYHSFKKQINNFKIPKRYKSKLFVEFKSTLLDSRFQKVKIKMLESLNQIDDTVIYSAYIKKTNHIKQSLKDKTYIKLLSSIVNHIDTNIKIDVIFDLFPNKRTIDHIISTISKNENVNSIKPADSQLVPGLQYVDNLCSVVRLNKSGTDEYGFYEIIKKDTVEVAPNLVENDLK